MTTHPNRVAPSLVIALLYNLILMSVVLVYLVNSRSLFDAPFPQRAAHLYTNSDDLSHLLKQHQSTLDHLHRGFPPLPLDALNLPDDLDTLPTEKRTSLFIVTTLSHAMYSNKKILLQRKKLIRYIITLSRGNTITPEQKRWYSRLAKSYSVPHISPEQLLELVDSVPVSMTVAQAIIESGWGTSRFARRGNSLFGQHLAQNSQGRYIPSLSGTAKVAAFDSLLEATDSYIHTLNSSRPYAKFRALRKAARDRGEQPKGYVLAEGLDRYSEIGEKYITHIRYLIKRYKLDQFDTLSSMKSHIPLTILFRSRNEHDMAQTAQGGEKDADKSHAFGVFFNKLQRAVLFLSMNIDDEK